MTSHYGFFEQPLLLDDFPDSTLTIRVFFSSLGTFSVDDERRKLETFSISRGFLFTLPNEPKNVYKLKALVTNVCSRF
jgi:hypothetical protein